MNKNLTLAGILLPLLLVGKMQAQCGSSTTYTTPGVLNDCTVPTGVTYLTINATGAHGGDRGTLIFGGTGGTVTATFNVTVGDLIRVIVGAVGSDGSSDGGGGGGTAIINCGNPADCANGTLLIVAGAGGGARNSGGGANSTAGSGNGGGAFVGNGGGGINSAGGNSSNGGSGGGQASKTSISSGGSNSGSAAGGGGSGFGGGGGGVAAGSNHGGGGGGGYSGGNGAGNSSGGTNYVHASGTNVTNTGGNTNGSSSSDDDGSVTVTFPEILPVELVRFTAFQHGNAIELDWQTASEINNEGFEIQHSPDARHWQTLAFVAGHGASSEPRFYAFSDEQPLPGVNYYRLRQQDFDGRQAFSPVLAIELPGAQDEAGLRFFPNPARQGITTFFFPETSEMEGTLEIFDLPGNRIFQQKMELEKGSVPVDLSAYATGIYTARLKCGGELRTGRLVVGQ